MDRKSSNDIWQPCSVSNCQNRDPIEVRSFKSLLPIVSFFFFVMPVMYFMGEFLLEVAEAKPGDRPIPPGLFSHFYTSASDKVFTKVSYGIIVGAIVVSFLANMVRLYFSMWLTEAIEWKRISKADNNTVWEKSEILLRILSLSTLYFSAYLVPYPIIPFELPLFICYLSCFIWDIGAMNHRPSSFWEDNSSVAKNAIKSWAILDGLGTVFIVVYFIAFLYTNDPLGRALIIAILSGIYLTMAFNDFKSRESLENGGKSLYWKLLTGDPISYE